MEILKNKNLYNFGIYVIGNVLNSAIPFLLLPFLTSHLSQSQMGIIANLELLVAMCLPLISLNTGSAVTRFFFEFSRSEHRNTVYNHLLIMFVVSLFLTLVFIILDPIISKELVLPTKIAWLAVIVALAKQLIETSLNMLRVTEKPVQFGIIRIASTAFDMSISILLIWYVYESWEGRFYGQLIAFSFFALISILLMIRKKWVGGKYSKKQVKQIVVFGAPLIPHTIGVTLLAFGDRWLIGREISEAAVGVYYVGYQVGMIMSLVQTSFNQAWSPWFYKKLTKPTFDDKKLIVKLTYLYTLLLFGIAFVLYVLTPLIFDLFVDSSYDSARPLVIWVLMGYAFNGIYKMMVNYLMFEKKTMLVGIITIATAALNIGLNLWLIPENGILGAAQATTISFIVQMILTSIAATRFYSMPWLGNRNGK